MRLSEQVNRFPKITLFVFWALVFSAIAMWLGTDTDWDLRNYHLYVPLSILTGRDHTDLFPAQRQSFIVLPQDFIAYFVRSGLNDYPRMLSIVLSLPSAFAALLTTCLALRLVPATWRHRRLIAVLVAGFGATGAAGLSTTASAMGDALAPSGIMAAILLVLPALTLDDRPQGPDYRRLAGAGLLLGAAGGMKLTNAPYAVAFLAAFALSFSAPYRIRALATAWLGVMAGLGAVIVAGPWWLKYWWWFGNPLFPEFNNVFHSSYYEFTAFLDNKFKAPTLLQEIFFPFFWGFTERNHVAEVGFRDPRFALAYLSVVVFCAQAAFGRFFRAHAASGRLEQQQHDPAARFLMLFFVVSYAMWQKLFSIFRYLAPIELLCGIIVFIAVRNLLRAPGPSRLAAGAMVLLIAASLPLTWYPDWGRAGFDTPAVAVHMPDLPPTSLVILLDGSPMSYFAAFVPQSVRFVGANSNMVYPGQHNLLQQQVETAIRTHSGPLWGMQHVPGGDEYYPGADATLRYYGLSRALGCARIKSNLDHDLTLLCPLVRGFTG